MSGAEFRGPGGLVVHEAGLDPARLDLDGGPAGWTRLPATGLREFVEEHFMSPAATRVCVFLDAPSRTSNRAAAALAVARLLITHGRSVMVVDGDDQQPDLSAWAGRLETEGWIDVVRYGVSPAAASVPLPWGPSDGRLLGVGSYQPVRAEPEEVWALRDRLLDEYDAVLICASTGDRGAYWAGITPLRVLCWDRTAASEDETAELARDAAVLGAPLSGLIAFGVADGVSGTRGIEQGAADGPREAVEGAERPRRSSPVFRRLAVSLTVLVLVLGSWLMGQFMHKDDDEAGVLPPVTQLDEQVADAGEPLSRPAPAETLAVAETETGAESVADMDDLAVADEAGFVPEDTPPPSAQDAPAPVVTEPPAADWSLPVEAGTYCLHVYSMADSTMAREQIQWMERRGVTGLVRRWRDVDEKMWYRIYAGSFGTLQEAREAIPEIQELLETDWAMPKTTRKLL